jgi:di/tricarboxylate transporter
MQRSEAFGYDRCALTFPLVCTVAVLCAVFLARDRLAPGIALFAATMILLVTRVITSQQALAGLANPAVVMVAALSVVARATQRTGALDAFFTRLMGAAGRWRVDLVRLLFPSAAFSAFINNTPIVAMLVQLLTTWADERRVAPSRYLLPMSYAVSLGGTLTLIGTSTNLVASGLMVQSKLAPISMFELTRAGLILAVLGVVLLILVAPIALRERPAPREMLREAQRDYALTMTVVPGGPLDGTTVEMAGLRHLQGVFLVEVARQRESISPVTPVTALEGGDRLTFVGRADDIVDLQRIRGLASSEETHTSTFSATQHPFFEAVLGPGSPLIGKTLKELGFRARYQGAVVAIHRAGERIRDKLGSVQLQARDTLLFIAEPSFRRSDFLLVTRVGRREGSQRRRRGRWVGILFPAVVLCAGAGLLPLMEASLLAAAAVVVGKVLRAGEAREAVDLDILLVIASAFAIGAAVETSGLGRVLGEALVRVFAPFGARGALLGVTLFCVAMAQILTCNAAAAISIPLGIAVAQQLGLDARPFCIAITFAASSSYMTPLGYQTKIMVYGPGGYRFGDYLRVGAPLTLLAVVVIVAVVPIWWPLAQR